MPENQNDSVETENTVTDVEAAPAAVFIEPQQVEAPQAEEAPQSDVQQDEAPQADAAKAEARIAMLILKEGMSRPVLNLRTE